MLPLAVSAPACPTPVEEIAEALERVPPLHGLSFEDRIWMAENAEEVVAQPGDVLFEESTPADWLFLILKGEIHVQRQRGGPMALFIGRAGQMTGLLPFSRMKTFGGQGVAVTQVWGLLIHKSKFPEMLDAIPSMKQRSVSTLLDRVREVTRIELQAEKLTARGKLAGNLAHELNNPASAAQRSAASLFGELRRFGDQKQVLGATLALAGQTEQYWDWVTRTREKMANYPTRAILPDNPIDLSDREDMFRAWLAAHNIPEPWIIASIVAESPMT